MFSSLVVNPQAKTAGRSTDKSTLRRETVRGHERDIKQPQTSQTASQIRPFFGPGTTWDLIHPKTSLMNMVYQRLLAGTAWENYQLVTTQWLRLEGNQAAPVPATQGGDMTTTFPGAGAFSAFANLTMETFDQSRPQLGCMSCHDKARLKADFMWSVLDHAYPAKLPLAKSAVAAVSDEPIH